MARLTGIIFAVLACAFVVSTRAEIVKVSSPEIQAFDGEKWFPLKAEGKRFMVYGARGDLYLIQLSAQRGKYAWVRTQDVQIDWGKSEVWTATVASVSNVNTLKLTNPKLVTQANTLKLTDGSLVQLRRILVPMEETPLKGQTEAWLKKLLEGKEVTLEFETSDKNARSYPETYVYVNGTFLNRTLVEYGLAEVPFSNEKGRYDAVLSYYVGQAREAGRGIWKEEKGEEDTSEQELASPSVSAESEVAVPRELTPALRQQWTFRMQVEVKVLKESMVSLAPEGLGTCEGASRPKVDDGIVTTGPRPKEHDGIVPAG